jgi:steroid delta-isomerase-like uncharacterized protein
MTNSIEKLVHELHESFSNNEFDKTLAFAADDVVVEAFAFGATFQGKQEFNQFMMGFKTAFPDLRIQNTNVISNGGEVAVEFTAKGTHTGELLTPAGVVPATGKSVNLKVCECQSWENGKLKSIRNYQDSTSLMRQLGLLN